MSKQTAILLVAIVAVATACNADDPISTGANNVNAQNAETNNAQTNNTQMNNTQTNNTQPVCGDGTVDTGEACDDGNTTAGDGCSATCTVEECGNGTVEGDEACDDGNTTAGDGCSDTCTVEECGNGTVEGDEACDDGNTTDGDGCSADCSSDETCGNGVVDSDEVCDDGNTTSGDGCSSDCSSDETCGNSIVDADEECDDGNTTSNDGCSDMCEVDCAVDLQLCQMACFDTQTSNEHCGDCDMPCGPAEQCGGGSCDVALDKCEVTANVFPLAIPNTNYGLGQLTFASDCSLLFVHGTPLSVKKIDPTTGAITEVVSTLTGSTASYALAVTERFADGNFYVTTDSEELWSVTPAGVATQVGTLAEEVSSLVVAPATFGNFGGMLIGATRNGNVVAIDHTNASFTNIYSGTGALADLEFGPAGTLYIANEGTDEIQSVDAAGNMMVIGDIGAAGGSGAEGVAVSPDGLTLYVPAGDTDALFTIDIATSTVTNVGTYDFDNGFFVSGVVVDAAGTVFMATGESSMTIATYP